MSTTTPQKNLEQMSYAELARQERRIRELMDKRYQEAAEVVNRDAKTRRLMQEMAKDYGVQIAGKTATATVTTAKAPNGSKTINKQKVTVAKSRKPKPGKVRYRDPSNPKLTWTGRGPQPGWLAAQTKSGRPLADFEVA